MRKLLALFLAAIIFLDVVSLGVLLFTSKENSVVAGDEVYNRASVAIAGSNIAETEILEQAKAREKGIDYDFSFVYEGVKDIVSNADLAVITQESVMSGEHGITGSEVINSPTKLGDELVDIGFDVVNIATDHILDYGEQGMLNTLDYWESKDVITAGVYRNKEEAENEFLTYTDINGIRIAFISYTETTGDRTLPEETGSQVCTAGDYVWIESMVKRADKKADVVIVCPHWGDENSAEVTEDQKNTAKNLAAWGADVIVGTHPRYLQKAEYITNSNGTRTFVAYSLGNFVADKTKEAELLGGLLTFDAVKNTENQTTEIENVRINGVVTHYGQNMTKIRVYSLDRYSDELAEVHGLNKESKFTVKYFEDKLAEVIDKQFLES